MRTKKVLIAALALSAVMLAGCSSASSFVNPGDYLGGGGTASSTPEASDSGYSAEISGAIAGGAAYSDETEIPEGAIKISEELGNLTISEAGAYYTEGEIADKIEIAAEGVRLYLKDATLKNGKQVIDCACGLTITLIGQNEITNTNTSDAKNAVDVSGDLIINGSGSLEISSVKNGIKANSISVVGATLDVTAEGDGLHAEVGLYDDALHSNGKLLIEGGTITLSSGDDAVHSDELLQINGGEMLINKCYEGIESAKVEISGGRTEVNSYEDGINAADGTRTAVNVSNDNCHIIISGGYISVNCIGSEGDGIDSNGTILISGGETYVAGSSNNSDAALDADGGIVIDGGYVFAAGSLGMVETPATNSAQYCVSFARSQSISAGTTLYLCDADGNIIMYFTAPRSCQSVILSCPEFVSGESYSIYGGDSLLSSFTISSTITTVGSASSIGNPGGMPSGGDHFGNIPGNTPGFGRR